jgi:hypothetical protein
MVVIDRKYLLQKRLQRQFLITYISVATFHIGSRFGYR